MSRLLLSGSRSFENLEQIIDVVDHFTQHIQITEFVFGGDENVISIYEQYMMDTGLPVRRYHHIKKYFARIRELCKQTDYAIVFWDGKEDTGTHKLIKELKRYKVKYRVVKI